MLQDCLEDAVYPRTDGCMTGRCVYSPMRLGVFLTLGGSLASWENAGILSRELAIYKRLAGKGVEVVLISYGRGDENRKLDSDGSLVVVANSFRLPHRLYQWALPVLHSRVLRQCDLYKTNQMNGAQVALRAARLFGKPLVARCGYMWSTFAAEQYGNNSRERRYAERIERRVFARSDHISVTTRMMKNDIDRRIELRPDKCEVIPNYVDTETFRPALENRHPDRVIYVGRLEKQKNVGALAEAVAELGLEATFVGTGSEGPRLRERYGGVAAMKWIDRVAHEELPQLLNTGSVYVIPSFYEGHPKTLIEAMACGLPVIGADVPGIQNVIQDGVTGLLCAADSVSLVTALRRVLRDQDLRGRLGRAARQFVVSNYSLNEVAEREYELLRKVLDRGRTVALNG